MKKSNNDNFDDIKGEVFNNSFHIKNEKDECNREVIIIDQNGNTKRMNLDIGAYTHAEATMIILEKLNIDMEDNSFFSFVVGNKASKKGLVVLHIDNKNVFLYLPSNITAYQLKKLKTNVISRPDFSFFIKDPEKIYENFNQELLLLFLNLIEKEIKGEIVLSNEVLYPHSRMR